MNGMLEVSVLSWVAGEAESHVLLSADRRV